MVANGVYPWFGSTPSRYRNFGARAGRIAGLLKASRADCATFGEMGRGECQQLAEHLPGWQYDRAQGTGAGNFQEGLNSIWTKASVWSQPESEVRDYVLPSGDQSPRTLVFCKVTEKADPTTFVTLGAYHETLGNNAGMAYVMSMIAKLGERRCILGGDFKRTDDDDDIAVMKKAGFRFHERVSSTPMTCITQHGVTVYGVDHRADLHAFDHDYLVVDFSIPTKSA
jgi:hypothetical protein